MRNLDHERELHRETEIGYLGFEVPSRRDSSHGTCRCTSPVQLLRDEHELRPPSFVVRAAPHPRFFSFIFHSKYCPPVITPSLTPSR